ncbi:major facilitator superfamily transporter [Fusarium longipes]|uniref:Major facilitator superfamily transporter n=1 Tax=Fusarium longipes TaxID=694270 RepID=A0A395SLY6_9HYPO|nr:major facilitator superfamily transporter [Fusarium longipes]
MSSAEKTTSLGAIGEDDAQSEKPGRQQDELATIPEEFDSKEEKKLVKKLDLFIMPIMAVVYFFQYIDRNSINYTAVFGLVKDLDLTNRDFSIAVSLFYVGQLISQYPAAYILSRFHITRFIGATIIVCGIMEMCTAATRDFEGLAACRFLLGFAQAAVSPAFIILTSTWYRQHEHPMRVATWLSMNGISQIVGGLFMYALGNLNMEIRSWRVTFLVFGGCTLFFGVLFVVMMPVDTATAWFLNKREREIATKRLAIDRATCDNGKFDSGQLREALYSPLSWLYLFMAFLIASANPITKVTNNPLRHLLLKYANYVCQYSSMVIERVGFSGFDSMLVGLPAGLLNFITSWVSALVPLFFPNTRIYTAMCLILVPLSGSIMLFIFSGDTHDDCSWVIVASTWLATCYTAPLCSCAGLLASNVRGNTKKSIVGAGFFIAYSTGSIIAPQVWGGEGGSRYLDGFLYTILSWSSLMVVLITYLYIVKGENKLRDQLSDRDTAIRRWILGVGGQDGRDDTSMGMSERLDLTDSRDYAFRYST